MDSVFHPSQVQPLTQPSVQSSKRMIPALGTFVRLELQLSGEEFIRYSNLVFAEIARVESLFSKFAPKSEISRLNEAEVLEWVSLSFEVMSLLKLAQTLTTESKGSFQAGPELEFDSSRARKRKDGVFDLGGIAKGYAIDCGVNKLFEARRKTNRDKIYGSLNAGGDLFIFANQPVQVELQHETKDEFSIKSHRLTHGAVATSSLSTRRTTTATYPFHSDSRIKSVTVAAPTATLADAFTKIALFGTSREIFAQWGVEIIHEV